MVLKNKSEIYKIREWCTYFELSPSNYTINDETGVVDYNGDINIMGKYLYNGISIQFGTVTGNFKCCYNGLKYLEGCPEKVGGNFDCSNNEIITLKSCPRIVGADFNCSHNQIISLANGPIKVGGYLHCWNNPVWKEYSNYNSYTQYMRFIKLKELIL
jgi:hypothetical protein